jgi:hypothetical protein
VLTYNLTRVMNIMGIQPLMAVIRVKAGNGSSHRNPGPSRLLRKAF